MKAKTEFTSIKNRNLQFEHLTKLLALLICEDIDFTIEGISLAMDIPIFQARQYILDLFSIKELTSDIECYQEDNTGNYIEIDVDYTKKELWSKQLLTGYFDTYIFKLNPAVLYIGDKLPLWLSQIEYSQLTSKYPDLFNQAVNTLKTKRDISSLPQAVKERVSEIQAAILNKYEIEFSYNGTLQTGIFPQFLYHDTDRNIIYCVDSERNCYRLDRIDSASRKWASNKNKMHDIKITKTSTKPPLSEEDRKKCDYMWGMADFKEAPIQVCVKIYHDTRNLLNKVKDETRLRKYARIEEHDGFSYYYDTIIGVDNFRSWLRSYGSSLIVLEPESLAKKMKESAKKIINLYS